MIDITRMSSIALVDYAIADSEKRQTELAFRRQQLERQVSSTEENDDGLALKLQNLNFELQLKQAGAADSSDPQRQAFCQNQVLMYTKQIADVQKDIAASSTDRIQSKIARIAEFDALDEMYDQYIADLQTKRAQLVAAAA